MVQLAVIQGSLNPNSRTSIVIDRVLEVLKEKNIEHVYIDLRQIRLPSCDGRSTAEYPDPVQDVYRKLEAADGYIIGMPVYQTTLSGPLKNLLDIMGGAMEYKAVGLVCNSGGVRSYLAGADMLKLLSYEMWTVMVQPTVHTTPEDFADSKVANEKALSKLTIMIENVCRYAVVEPARPE